jgi:hypothetical protein
MHFLMTLQFVDPLVMSQAAGEAALKAHAWSVIISRIKSSGTMNSHCSAVGRLA